MVLDSAQDIIQAIKMQIPTVVITEKDSECHREALKYLPPAAVVYYSDGKMQSDQKTFSNTEGLTIQTLNEICLFISENQFYPNIFIWQPRKKTRVETPQQQLSQMPPPVQEPQPVQQQPQKPQPVQQKPPQPKHSPAQTEFNSFINNKDIIAVFKSTPDANSEAVAQEIAQRLNAGYLKVAPQLNKSTVNCAYSDGDTVNYNADFTPNKLIVEVDAQVAAAMETIYGRASKIIHVCGANIEAGVQAVKNWVSSGFKLDAVIPDSNGLVFSYKAEIPQTISIEEFANK